MTLLFRRGAVAFIVVGAWWPSRLLLTATAVVVVLAIYFSHSDTLSESHDGTLQPPRSLRLTLKCRTAFCWNANY
ncbi:hypothetical protein L596_024365 [Steinernema carpocapsae]|uniref:Uncharacterized protein n=1 Tax=Steinernema carpocapsae TaxID=34508 RepID=A0A4V5ZZR2_STECR|nr:hypothetical protein L596_024365 [Steinernema carpocapsae]